MGGFFTPILNRVKIALFKIALIHEKKKDAESVSSTLWNKELQFSLSKHNSLSSLDCLPYTHYDIM